MEKVKTAKFYYLTEIHNGLILKKIELKSYALELAVSLSFRPKGEIT